MRERHRACGLAEGSGASCAAMHMCANEAVLSEAQTKALYEAIRATPGCQEP